MSLSRYYIAINLLVLSLAIYCSVDVFYTLADSKLTKIKAQQATTQHLNKMKAQKKWHPFDYYLPAINRDLFGASEEPADTSKQIEIEDLERTALNISLLGTVSGYDENAVAIIQERAKRSQSLYKIGDQIQNATIIEILRGKVILRVGSKNQILTMEENTSASGPTPKSQLPQSTDRRRAPSVDGSTITLDRSTVGSSLGDLSKLLSQVRVRPHYKNGKPDGLMLSQVKPNTIFTRLGLRNGDVIQNVGGKTIGNPDDIMGFYEELKSGSDVSLEIMRRGRKKALNYKFQ